MSVDRIVIMFAGLVIIASIAPIKNTTMEAWL